MTDTLKFTRRYLTVSIVILVALLVGVLVVAASRKGPSPSDRCAARLTDLDVLHGTPIVEHLPGGDVQVNGRFYDPRVARDRAFLCNVRDGRVTVFVVT